MNSLGEDGGGQSAFAFDDQTIRKGFIRKVYSILMCQLLVTMGFIAIFVFHVPTQRFAMTHSWLFWAALAVTIVCLIPMACCPNVRRTAPVNYIFLAIFTIAESFLLGMISIRLESSEVMFAVGVTAAVCLGLTLFAFQTKWDFTTIGGILIAATIILLIFGLIAIFTHSGTMRLVYAALGVLLFSIYLVHDTQLMMGGKHKYSVSPEEYIFAALNLYLDIINMFIYILMLISGSR